MAPLPALLAKNLWPVLRANRFSEPLTRHRGAAPFLPGIIFGGTKSLFTVSPVIVVPCFLDALRILLPARDVSSTNDYRVVSQGFSHHVAMATSNFFVSLPDFTGALLGSAPARVMDPDSFFATSLASSTVISKRPGDHMLPLASDRRSSVPGNSVVSICLPCVSFATHRCLVCSRGQKKGAGDLKRLPFTYRVASPIFAPCFFTTSSFTDAVPYLSSILPRVTVTLPHDSKRAAISARTWGLFGSR